MVNKILIGAIAIVLLAMAYVGYDALLVEHPEPVAKLVGVKGSGSVRRQTDVLKAETGLLLYAGDALSTPSKSKLQVQFSDGTLVLVGAETGLVVDNYDFDSEANLVTAQLRFVKGAIRAVTGRAAMARSIKVAAPGSTTIGIRGTDLIIANLQPNVLDVLLVDSKKTVSVDNRDGSVKLNPGEGTTVERGEAPTPAKIWPESKVARALALVEK